LRLEGGLLTQAGEVQVGVERLSHDCICLINPPRVRRVEGAGDGLADNDVEHGGAFAIDKFCGATASAFNADIDIECRGIEGDFGAEELNCTCTRRQPEGLPVRRRTEVRMHVAEDRVKVDLNHRIFDRLGNVIANNRTQTVASAKGICLVVT